MGGVMIAVFVLAACARRDTSARIVCEVDGVTTPTAFTFDSFCQAVEREHGPIEVEANAVIKSRSLEVYFRRLEDGQLLAERVVWVGMFKQVTPAMLFGLAGTNDLASAPPLQVE